MRPRERRWCCEEAYLALSLVFFCAFRLRWRIRPIVSAALCIAILLWRRIAPADWASAMLLLAIPGMIGEAVVLSHMSTFMPRLQATSGGRYGAFLFATYAVVLALAEVVSLRAAR